MREGEALASLHICADSTMPSLLDDPIYTKISCAGSYVDRAVVEQASNNKQEIGVKGIYKHALINAY